jgi:hypothetical protein
MKLTSVKEDPTIKLIPWTRTMGKAPKMAETAQGQVIARRGSVGAYRRRKTPNMSRDSRSLFTQEGLWVEQTE